MTEFIDCGSLSISFDATGKTSVSLVVLKDDASNLTVDYTKNIWGGRRFDCVITNVSQRHLIGSSNWYEWSLQMEGVVNR